MRVRLRFTKLGKVRFLGHRDVARAWERAIRRAALPIAYSEGFSPRPRLHFGLALSTGAESVAEYLDIDLRDDGPAVAVDALPALLSPCLPVGIDVTGAARVADHEDSLQAVVGSSTWTVAVTGVTAAELAERVAAVAAATELPVTIERKGKAVVDDLRPAIVDLRVGDDTPDGAELCVELATAPRTFRPTELLAAFDPPLTHRVIRRDEQWMTLDGERRPPVARSTSGPVAVPLAS